MVSGIDIEDVAVGTGPEADRGQVVSVRWKGTLNRGDSFGEGEVTFRAGGREVVAGLSRGVVGMRVGGVRRLRVSPRLGYRDREVYGVPANAVLMSKSSCWVSALAPNEPTMKGDTKPGAKENLQTDGGRDTGCASRAAASLQAAPAGEPGRSALNRLGRHDRPTAHGTTEMQEMLTTLITGKLLDVHLNGQKPLRFDQDLSLDSDDLKEAFFTTKLLAAHQYPGTIGFDAHPYRSEADPWDFVERNMHTYNIMKDKVQRFNENKEDQAKKLKDMTFDVAALTSRKLPYERLDQLVNELLLGVLWTKKLLNREGRK